jgi:integrase
MTMAGSSRSLAKKRIPGYLLHKPTGRARVRINGVDIYLGEYGSVESRRKYAEVIAHHCSGLDARNSTGQPPVLTVNELALAFMRHADSYYVKDGKKTSEVEVFKLAVRPLVDLCGVVQVANFGPLALRSVRDRMVANGNLCRKSVNQAICRIRTIFRWGVSHEMVHATVLTALEAVEPLKAGRTTARETEKRKPVDLEIIEQVKAVLPQRTRDLIDLQLLTGARPGELLKLTPEMIERGDEVWTARIEGHKNAHRGKERILVFGRKSQEILQKYLSVPKTTRLFCLQRDSYGKAVKAACVKVGVKTWTPHFLRHNAGKAVRLQFGGDYVQALLGQSSLEMAHHYSDVTLERASEVARQVG